MNLVIIYGPPGVGKLTVAKELSRLTGYKVFHNHLTLNYVSALFDWDDTFWRLVRGIRLQMIEAAADEGVNLVFTCVYPAEEDDEHLRQFKDAVEKYGGRMRLVQLLCERDVHETRLVADGRAALYKMTSVASLRRALEREPRMIQPAQGFESLCLDNTHIPPDEAARQIAAHYGLPFVQA
jgi:hypothetical protein